jgi:hypothetical protein
MHRFTINDIGQRWTSIPGTTFGYYDVQLPDHAVPGHAVVNVTDVGDNDAFRAHIVGFLNTIVEERGADNVIADLSARMGCVSRRCLSLDACHAGGGLSSSRADAS